MRKFTLHFPVRAFEVDRMGHVPLPVFLSWMEVGWYEVFREVAIGELHPIPGRGLQPYLIHCESKWKRPLRFGDTTRMEAVLMSVTDRTLQMRFRFTTPEDETAFRGLQEIVLVDANTREFPRPLRVEERERLQAFLESDSSPPGPPPTDRRKHPRLPSATDLPPATVVMRKQQFSLIVHDFSEGGTGLVATQKLSLHEGQWVIFRHGPQEFRARIAYIIDFQRDGIDSHRLGLEWLDRLASGPRETE